ncbi:TonB-dependent receptor [Tsuneonella sp. HG222]
MKLKYLLAASVVSLSAAVALPAPVAAQETTSSVRGTVNAAGAPVAGATVVVTHVPSGTTQTTTTDADGNFAASGLRVGGPFQVTVDASGYETTQVDELYLQAGQSFRLPIEVQAANEIVVTASNLAGARETSTGPITVMTSEEIEGVASVSRDIRDIARRDAFVTIDASNARTIEVAGQNGRLNRFSVDGVQLSDDFGINNGGLPTSRGPVPYDAIEQLSVKVAPYDISEGDFQGGAVNVVLRSGGNRFTGSAFYTYSDDKLTGDNIAGTPVSLDFTSKSYGGFLSGPIIQDTLFFAVAYEKLKESDPIDEGPGDAGFAVPIPRVTTALASQISSIANSVYGYDTLGIFSSAAEEDEKIVAKLDWNVSDAHRVALTYIRNVGNQQISQNNVTSVTGPTLGFQSNGYELTEEINSGSFQLNSQWTDALSTELRVAYRDYNRGQNPFGDQFAQFEVCTDPTSINNSAIGNTLTSCGNTITSNPRFFFGPDISRQANVLNTENLAIDLTPRFETGNHSFKGLLGYSKTKTFNLFLQRATGDIYFDSIADFQNRIASRVRFASAVPSLDANDAAAKFSTEGFTIGLQDDWQATDALKLSIGARYDLTDTESLIPLNPNFVARVGYGNTNTFTGLGVFQPRIGFEWDPGGRFILRGGVGKFAGGAPDVFLSNSFSNTGQLSNAIDIQRTTTAATCNSGTLAFCNAALTNISGSDFPSVVDQFLTTNIGSLAAAPVNAIDPDYELPSQWRSTLSASYDADLGPLGDGWLFGADLLYGRTIAANTYVDARSVVIGTLPDGRPRYARTTQGILAGDTNQTNQDLILTSTDQGRSIVGVVRFEKEFDWGLGIGASYTRSDIKDVNPITSATAGSLYGNAAMADPNNAAYGRSIYEFTNSVKLNFDYKHAFFGDYETRFSLFGEWRNGRPFSYTMRDPATGRAAVFGTNGSNSRYLLYVPTGTTDALVSYDSTATRDALDALISGTKLSDYRGAIAPKNLGTSPGYWKVDLHAEQEIPAFFGSARFKVFGDIENVLNLLDSDWGVQRQVAFAYFAPVVNVQCLSAPVATGTSPTSAQINTVTTQTCAQYRYSSYSDPNIVVQNQGKQSLYQIRVGIRFEF